MSQTLFTAYSTGRENFDILSGNVQPEEMLTAIRDGYTALHTLFADGKIIADITKATKVTRAKVGRDKVAAAFIVALPDVPALLIAQVANMQGGTKTAMEKACADPEKAQEKLEKLQKSLNTKRRTARPNDGAEAPAETAAETPAETPAAAETPATVEDSLKAIGAIVRGLEKRTDITEGEKTRIVADMEQWTTLLKRVQVAA
jgi:hypothetical protein